MPYIAALDGVRAISALIVLAFHVRLPGFQGGFVGVDVFFVLSGFLISSILLRRIETGKKLEILQFLKRRLMRLYPALIFFLLVMIVALPIFFPGRSVLAELGPAATYTANYMRVFEGTPDVLRHTWSLAVEMQFYIIWPFVLVQIARWSHVQRASILVALYVMVTIWRGVAYFELGACWAYYATDTRLSGLILGSVFALLPRTDRFGRLRDMLGIGLIFVGFAFSRYYTASTAFLYGPVAEVGAAILIQRLASGGSLFEPRLSSLNLRKLGHWSYGIYLWQYPVAYYTRDIMPSLFAFMATATVSIALAALSFEVVERRFRAGND